MDRPLIWRRSWPASNWGDGIFGDSGVHPLFRHQRGDFGQLCPEDLLANLRALRDGSRIFSVYRLLDDVLWIVTDAETVGETGVPTRNVTTLLLPEEY